MCMPWAGGSWWHGWDKDQAASSLDDQLLGTTRVPIVGAERMVQGAATSARTQVHTLCGYTTTA